MEQMSSAADCYVGWDFTKPNNNFRSGRDTTSSSNTWLRQAAEWLNTYSRANNTKPKATKKYCKFMLHPKDPVTRSVAHSYNRGKGTRRAWQMELNHQD